MKTNIVPEIIKRRAFRAFSTEKVDNKIIERIMEAARLTPSCGNKQPWRFLVLTEESALQKGFKALSGGNYWAKHSAFLVFGITKRDLDCQMPDGRGYAHFDTGMAVENMMLQAVREGLIAHPMAGYNPSAVVEEFGIPEGYEVVVVVAFGYPGEGEYLGEKHKALENAPQTRKKYEEVITFNEWSL
ncbi:MAG: nitroreductase family protein [Bacteroidetes bacterium]|nr:nitroreductase family protein [Bacteroidota bacterium]